MHESSIADLLADSYVPGSIFTQVLVTLVFTPSVWKSLQLDLEFQSGSLMLMVDMNVAGRVIWNHLAVSESIIAEQAH